MAVTFQTETGASGTGNFTPSKPSGTTTDDLLILHVCYEKGSAARRNTLGRLRDTMGRTLLHPLTRMPTPTAHQVIRTHQRLRRRFRQHCVSSVPVTKRVQQVQPHPAIRSGGTGPTPPLACHGPTGVRKHSAAPVPKTPVTSVPLRQRRGARLPSTSRKRLPPATI
jgi:hypothetical protein